MYKSILIPVESSHIEESAATVELAKNSAADEAKIHLLNVFQEIPKWASTNLPENIIKDSIQAIEKQLQAVAKSAGSEVTTQVEVGHSYKTILDVAAEIEADLIIVASHQPDAHQFYLGSTAAKVVRHARCSVLVLR